MALTFTNTKAEGCTPDPSLTAQVASLVELIQALRHDLTATQGQIRTLTNAREAHKATKPSFATVAASGPAPPSHQWQIVTKKPKKVRPEPLFKHDYSKVNRELIIELSSPIPSGVTEYTINTAANKALASTAVIFCLARRTTRGNIILLTRPINSASSGEPYGCILTATLQKLGCTPSSTRANRP
ncbi:hypothetical protein Q9L58_009957 [Maublancomyces gigas]|uniref:Uncharacterized protein n=1 Tax=Discina gigas TaxID=1032678 RepID=A0ABR3G640_9PEZI